MTVLFSLSALVTAAPSLARQAGIINKSKTGCGACHGAAPTPEVQVLLEGPSELQAGASADYTVTVSGGPAVAAGVNVSIEAPDVASLEAGTNTKLLSEQITHNAPVLMSGGSAAFTFRVNAGADAGSLTIYAAGNSVDLTGTNAGDQYNLTRMDVSVLPGSERTPSTEDETPLSDGSVQVHMGERAGCTATGAEGGLWLLGLGALRRWRRRSVPHTV